MSQIPTQLYYAKYDISMDRQYSRVRSAILRQGTRSRRLEINVSGGFLVLLSVVTGR